VLNCYLFDSVSFHFVWERSTFYNPPPISFPSYGPDSVHTATVDRHAAGLLQPGCGWQMPVIFRWLCDLYLRTSAVDSCWCRAYQISIEIYAASARTQQRAALCHDPRTCWHCLHSTRSRVYMKRSVSHHSTAAAVCGGFAAEHRAGRRRRSSAAGAGHPPAMAPQHSAQQQTPAVSCWQPSWRGWIDLSVRC